MVQPRIVVDALGNGVEHHEVVGAQVQATIAAAEIEALVGPELAAGVLAAMASTRNAAGRHGEPLCHGAIAEPAEHLTVLFGGARHFGQRAPERAGEALERPWGVDPHADEDGHALE